MIPEEGSPMIERALVLPAMWLVLAASTLRHAAVDRLRQWWGDERGEADGSVARMIWLAVGIAVAIAAGAFLVQVFNSAKDAVPDPTPPAP
jgi:hypothetical protein